MSTVLLEHVEVLFPRTALHEDLLESYIDLLRHQEPSLLIVSLRRRVRGPRGRGAAMLAASNTRRQFATSSFPDEIHMSVRRSFEVGDARDPRSRRLFRHASAKP
jgi:hypothetical protein